MATISNTNNYLSSLINAGADAMTNLFYVKFSGGLVDEIAPSLIVRLSDISLPTATQETFTINYMTTSLDVPKADISIDKKLDITFRLDSNYELYQYLLKQQALTSIPNLGYASNIAPDEPLLSSTNPNKDSGLEIKLYSMKTEVKAGNQESPQEDNTTPNYQLMYTFKYCWISEITPPSYSYSNSDALTVKASFYFYEYSDPQNQLS